MGNYIIVTTLCDKEKIKDKIVDTLLQKRLVAGAQVSKVYSKYIWNNKLEECEEYKIEFRTKENLFEKIEKTIKQIHDYEVCEISYRKIDGGSNEILNWIDENTKSN
ncbi:MAG: divalent-cation tolerance protein CutA [Bacilli bacterium]|nr:divalent-cation tolerance protein CutA [Bacilli bacterium]